MTETFTGMVPASSLCSEKRIPLPTDAPLLVRACRGELTERIPVWMMRQAGRYMPEYRAIREKVSFLELCKTSELAAEVSLQPYQAFGMDAVIMFCDILIPVEAMGLPLVFEEPGGPKMPQPVRSQADIDQLVIPDPTEKTGFVLELLRQLKQSLSSEKNRPALIGFAGAPWTLASYMIEGGTSRNFIHLKQMMFDEPKALHTLLGKLATTITHYLNAQIEAGAEVVQLFDTWAGILPLPLYREFVQPYHQQILAGLNRSQVPALLYVNRSQHLVEAMAETCPDGISVDELTPYAVARDRIPQGIALQGNLDPAALFCRQDVLKSQTLDLLNSMSGNPGSIFNLGHGILPKTPVENVRLVVDTVKAFRR